MSDKYQLGDKPEGNMAGLWDPATYEVEDSAFGFVTFKNGASLFVDGVYTFAARGGKPVYFS